MALEDIVRRALAREVRAVSRLISIIEDRLEGFERAYAEIYPHTGRAHIIGITGPPGSGKSTLVDKLAMEYRKRGLTVGVVAVDPTSPFSGGALLGDRLRMQRHVLDDGVFIRSMGTRGRLGRPFPGHQRGRGRAGCRRLRRGAHRDRGGGAVGGGDSFPRRHRGAHPGAGGLATTSR